MSFVVLMSSALFLCMCLLRSDHMLAVERHGRRVAPLNGGYITALTRNTIAGHRNGGSDKCDGIPLDLRITALARALPRLTYSAC